MKWPKACLGEVAQVVSGATPKSSVDEYWDGDIPWITPADLSKLGAKEISTTLRQITEAGLKNCSSRILPVRSVLLSSRGALKSTVAAGYIDGPNWDLGASAGLIQGFPEAP